MTAKNVKQVPKRGTKVFVKEGEHDKATKTRREPTILATACDWRIVVVQACTTAFRPTLQ